MKNKLKNIGNVILLFAALIIGKNSVGQVTPGAGGSLPAFTPFATVANKFGGLYVRSTERENNSFGGGTRAIVELRFPLPSQFSGTSYTLQYSTNNGSTWANYQYSGSDLTTTGDNFSLNFPADYKLRLLLNGGPKNGYTSNEVSAPLSSIDTRFSAWSLDESMTLTGTMLPFVERGLQASFTANKLSDNSVATGLSYQWYRVNPITYETTLIPTATNLLYATTTADAGYLLLIKASGDGTNTGGYAQVFSFSKTVIPNKASVSSVTSAGFTLDLYKTVSSGIAVEDLVLYDKNYDTVLITAVSQGANAAIYNITATLDTAKAPYSLHNNSDFWKITSTGPMLDEMEGVQFNYDLTSGIKDLNEMKFNIYPIPANDVVNIETEGLINSLSVININGQTIAESAVNCNKYKVDISELNSGIYFVKIETIKGGMMKKINVIK